MEIVYMDHTELLGLAGVSFYVLSYFLLQLGKIEGRGIVYVLMNLAAASLVLISLTKDFNLASALIQTFWIVISLIGILRIAFLSKLKYQQSV